MAVADELKKKTVKELRAIVKKYNADVMIRGYSTMKKADLIEAMLKKEVMAKIKNVPEVKPTARKPKPKPKPPSPVIEPDEPEGPVQGPRNLKRGFGIKRLTEDEKIGLYLKPFVELGGEEPEGTPFVCIDNVAEYMLMKILEKYKNDCVFVAGTDFSSGPGFSKLWLTPSDIRSKQTPEDLVERYLECKKGNKIVVGLVEQAKGGHANSFIINPFRKTLEHYEPHGEAYGGRGGSANLKGGFEKLVVKMNKLLGKQGLDEDKLTFSNSAQTCPRISKDNREEFEESFREGLGLQAIENKARKSKGVMREGRFFKSTTGFCCAWSLLHLEFRLKFPKLAENELASRMLEAFKKSPRDFSRKFIINYSKQLMEEMARDLGGWDKVATLFDYSAGEPRRDVVKKLRRTTENIIDNLAKKLLK